MGFASLYPSYGPANRKIGRAHRRHLRL